MTVLPADGFLPIVAYASPHVFPRAAARLAQLPKPTATLTPPSQVHRVPMGPSLLLSVLRYTPTNETDRSKPPLIFASSFGATQLVPAVRHPNTHFPHPVSLIDLLRDRGWDIWSFDYRDQDQTEVTGATMVYPWFNAADLADGDLCTVVHHVQRITGQDRVWLGGLSLGGMLSLLFAAGHTDMVGGLVLVGTPIQWQQVPWWVQCITQWPELLALLPTGKLHRGLKASAWMAPLAPDWLRPRWARRANAALDDYQALREVIGRCSPSMNLLMARWVRSRMAECRGQSLLDAVHALDVPLLTFVGGRDQFAPPVNVEPLMRAVSTPPALRRLELVPDATHTSLVFGGEAVDRVFAPMAKYLEDLV